MAGAATAVPLRGMDEDGSTLARIESLYGQGAIDRETYLLYRLYRVTDMDRLPVELVAPAE
jgi:hypothetical protein